MEPIRVFIVWISLLSLFAIDGLTAAEVREEGTIELIFDPTAGSVKPVRYYFWVEKTANQMVIKLRRDRTGTGVSNLPSGDVFEICYSYSADSDSYMILTSDSGVTVVVLDSPFSRELPDEVGLIGMALEGVELNPAAAQKWLPAFRGLFDRSPVIKSEMFDNRSGLSFWTSSKGGAARPGASYSGSTAGNYVYATISEEPRPRGAAYKRHIRFTKVNPPPFAANTNGVMQGYSYEILFAAVPGGRSFSPEFPDDGVVSVIDHRFRTRLRGSLLTYHLTNTWILPVTSPYVQSLFEEQRRIGAPKDEGSLPEVFQWILALVAILLPGIYLLVQNRQERKAR